MALPLRTNAVSISAAWVIWSASCVSAGWLLSAFGRLNAQSYAVFLVLSGGALLVGMRRRRVGLRVRRWRRALPAAFLLVALAAIAGGALYPASNIDALTYRLPRVMHWLEAGRWHWIETLQLRVNYSAMTTEWISAPILAVTRSSRLLFVFNALSFCLLPGLLFVWLRGLGASGKAAWRWMWITPMALGFALQAGSLGNDLLGAVYFLAGLAFAERGRSQRRVGWLLLAALAIGLATNVKASNLALVPMAAVAIGSAILRHPRNRLRVAGVAMIVCLAFSSVPTLVLNARYSGHWSGDLLNATAQRPRSVGAALAGNSTLLVLQNVAPPFFPAAGIWNALAQRSLVPWLRENVLGDNYPRFSLRLGELPQEEWAGLGLPFVLVCVVELWRSRKRPRPLTTRAMLFASCGALGLLAYAMAIAAEMPARHVLPFYFAGIAVVACRAPDQWVGRSSLWAAAVWLAIATALLAVVLTPARPLFPAARVFGELEERFPGVPMFNSGADVYRAYAERHDMLAPLRSELPADVATVAFLGTDDDSDWSLWKRPGTRVVHVRSLEDPRLREVEVLVVHADAFWKSADVAREALTAAGFETQVTRPVRARASKPSELWIVARR